VLIHLPAHSLSWALNAVEQPIFGLHTALIMISSFQCCTCDGGVKDYNPPAQTSCATYASTLPSRESAALHALAGEALDYHSSAPCALHMSVSANLKQVFKHEPVPGLRVFSDTLVHVVTKVPSRKVHNAWHDYKDFT